MQPLARYENGNYIVTLYPDGTKVKHTEDDFFCANFPDSIDLKITDRCDGDCPMCHESSTPTGKHADLSAPFLNTLNAGTELAIGGGNPLTHPKLKEFLERMKARGIICNMTVNERHLLSNSELLSDLINKQLIYGLGVSLNSYSPSTFEFAKCHRNTVFHLIAGVVTAADLDQIASRGAFKILVLGFKDRGRGKLYHTPEVDARISKLKAVLPSYFDRFCLISFDNLALAQLDVKSIVLASVFERIFMGEDGNASMFIDLVKKEYAVSSTSDARYALEPDLSQMFEKIRNR